MFHFLFVPLTLGLAVLVAMMETRYARTGDEVYMRMTRFWGKLFLINFALGVVTGITLEFQFGTNWSRYSAYVGDVFGSLLAIEATVAFFLESTLIGVWIFGWKKLSRRAHAAVMWLVAIAGNVSAIWILTANGWMQQPVGYVLRNGRAELADFSAVVFNSFSILQILHVIPAGFLLSAFFVMGISAWHLLRKQHVEVSTRSFRLGLLVGLISAVLLAVEGDIHAQHIARVQPAKLAAMESLWDTQTRAPMYLFIVPDRENERNSVQLGGVPGALSFLGFRDFDAEVRGLKDFPPGERPPVMATFVSFRVMVALGFYFILLMLIGVWRRNRLLESPLYLKWMLWSIPLPYLAIQFGWIVAEVGRQPWIVYGIMKTSDAVSPVSSSQVGTTLAAFLLVYGLLGAAGYYLMFRFARKGPEPAAGGASAADEGGM
jgi:cytochrome d ubiquinol oxidase subunit I